MPCEAAAKSGVELKSTGEGGDQQANELCGDPMEYPTAANAAWLRDCACGGRSSMIGYGFANGIFSINLWVRSD